MSKNIFKSNRLISAFMLSALVFSSVATAISPVSVLADPTDPTSPNPILGDSPKIKIIQKNYNYNFSTRRWGIDNQKSTTSYQEKICSGLYSQGIKGISDYKDGISIAAYNKAKNTSNFMAISESDLDINLRNCNNFNVKAGNLVPGCGNTYYNAKNNQDYTVFEYEVGCGNYTDFTPANNSVFAYYFKFNYEFPANQKTELSNTYRSKTGLEGDYNGVVWTYTYYTYKDLTTNQYKPWINPNTDNSNSGWLMYGIENEPEDCGDNCEITIDPIYTSTIKSNLNHDLTLSYRPATKELKFQGEVAVGNSGCWSLGNEHAFVIKPYSNGTYDSFKLFYETKDSGAEICTSNIPTQVLNYSQDMSDLSAEGEQFLKNYISQKRFKESDVEKYTGIMPVS